MNALNVFPTRFYETQINQDLAFAILEDIKSKKPQIDIVHEATQSIPVSDMSTDFSCPIDIPLFDQHVVPHLQQEFNELGIRLTVLQKWVSCYTGPYGVHPMHNHANGWEGIPQFAAIMYLTAAGETEFFNTALHSNQYSLKVSAEVGKVIFFPAIIPHQYNNVSFDGNHRYTLPFNIMLENL